MNSNLENVEVMCCFDMQVLFAHVYIIMRVAILNVGVYFLQFGFDGLFFGRLDYQDKDARLKNKTMEMMWMGSDNLGNKLFIF